MPIGVSRAPYVRFEKPGDRHGGEILEFRVVQKSDYDENRPLYFQRGEGGGKTFEPFAPDGTANQPICQWEVTVDTGVEDEHGDTERRVFIDPRTGKKGTPLEGKRGADAVNIALKKARAHRVGLEIGGRLFMTYEGKVRADKKSPETTTWSAEYEPPAGGPGSGTPVDEVPWLIGGARFDPAERATTAPAVAGAVEETVGDRLTRSYENSPVVKKAAQDDDTPPF